MWWKAGGDVEPVEHGRPSSVEPGVGGRARAGRILCGDRVRTEQRSHRSDRHRLHRATVPDRWRTEGLIQ